MAMDPVSSRRHRGSLSSSLIQSLASLDEDSVDTAWKLDVLCPSSSEALSSPLVGDLHADFHIPAYHDDLCVELNNPRCPTAAHLGSHHPSYRDASSSLSFSEQHYVPQSGYTTFSNGLPFFSSINTSHSEFTGHSLNLVEQANFFSSTDLSSADYGNVLVRSSLAEKVGDDASSTCDSDCGVGKICHGTACVDTICQGTACADEVCHGTPCSDDTPMCDDENCLQNTAPVTSEDARAAAALASFGGGKEDQSLTSSNFNDQSLSGYSSVHGGFQKDYGIENIMAGSYWTWPTYMSNVQHLLREHHPQQPTCTQDVCPIDDPNFFHQCHIRNMPSVDQNIFDNIDIGQLGNFSGGHECGKILETPFHMVEHLWTHHPNVIQAQPVTSQPMAAVSHIASSPDSSGASTSPAFRANSLSLQESASPLTPPASYETEPTVSQDVTYNSIREAAQSSQLPTVISTKEVHRCMWCRTPGSKACIATFSTAKDLQDHVLEIHTCTLNKDSHGQFACGWAGCNRHAEEGKGFCQKSKLDRHLQVHTGYKPFKCEVCGAAVSGKQALDQHMRIHQKEKPFQCDICFKEFRQQSALTMHKRTHTGEKPLTCDQCGQTFSESSNLSKHKRIHKGKGDFVCPFPGCGKHFRRGDQLRRHKDIHLKHKSSATDESFSLPAPEIRKTFSGVQKSER